MHVIKIGNSLFLSLTGDYVNNINHKDIRIFSGEQNVVGKLIADSLKGSLVPYTPFKIRGFIINRQQSYAFTKYEIDNLLVIKKDNKYLSYDGSFKKNIKNKKVIKLPIAELNELMSSDEFVEITKDTDIVVATVLN